MNFASWAQRAGGYILDGLYTGIPAMVGWCAALTTSEDGQMSGAGLVLYLLGALVTLCLSVYNRWILAGKTGQSWGRKALKIRMVSEQTGRPIGAGMAFVRDLCHAVDTLACYIGWLFPLWDAKRQTLADKIVKTVVVTAP